MRANTAPANTGLEFATCSVLSARVSTRPNGVYRTVQVAERFWIFAASLDPHGPKACWQILRSYAEDEDRWITLNTSSLGPKRSVTRTVGNRWEFVVFITEHRANEFRVWVVAL